MHDTFLNENLYETIVTLCRENDIQKVSCLVVTVHADSHINKDSIRCRFSEDNNSLIGDFTDIAIKKCGSERLTAIIERLDGEN